MGFFGLAGVSCEHPWCPPCQTKKTSSVLQLHVVGRKGSEDPSAEDAKQHHQLFSHSQSDVLLDFPSEIEAIEAIWLFLLVLFSLQFEPLYVPD